MACRVGVLLALATVTLASRPYERPPQYGYQPQPSYGYEPQYPQHPPPAYGHPKPPKHASYEKEPACAANTTKTWCLSDYEYPTYDIKHALEHNYEKALSLYSDVADLNTELSVDGLQYLEQETYLCPSETEYIQPLRAVNTDGKWRIIVNKVDVHYQTLTQTTRIEECLEYASNACPLVPECYESKCLQKNIYHRFLIYDPYDQYFPFAIESFKLPASCACLLGEFVR